MGVNNQPITVVEGNDETLLLTVVPVLAGDDLTALTELRLTIKDDRCDDDTTGQVLSSTNPAQISIDSHTADQVVARAYPPPFAGSHPRWYRVDGYDSAGRRRSPMGGVITVEAA